jgi:hypothetical protein
MSQRCDDSSAGSPTGSPGLNRDSQVEAWSVSTTSWGPELDLSAESICRQLERLDDAMFAAIEGCDEALAEAQQLWPATVAAVGWELLAESREHYLRCAMQMTRSPQNGQFRATEEMLATLQVISLLIGE